MRVRGAVVIGVFVGLVASRMVGCEPRAYFAACESDDDCPRGLQCHDNPHHEQGDEDEQVCTRSCESDADCPRRDNDHCGERYPCLDGVCGSNFGCR